MLSGSFRNMEEGNMFNSLEGKVLVASPHINDENFEHSLVYICVHDEHGAIGIIINQKIGKITDIDLKNYVKNFGDIIISQEKSLKKKRNTKQSDAMKSKNKKDYPVVFGGPVYSDKIVVLSLNKEQEKNFCIQRNLTYYSDIASFFKEYISGKKNHNKLLFAKGIAAWNPSQLEEEINQSHWFVVPASTELLFSQPSRSKWRNVIRELGISEYYKLVIYSGIN
jgi:putative transcriptional regulator